ncbi:hypothetical protein [Azospirillum sp. sgz301742]
MHGRLTTFGLALAAFLHVADAAAQPATPSIGDVIVAAQELKRAASSVEHLIVQTQDLKKAAPPRGPAADAVIEKAQDLKRKHAKDAPPPPPVLSTGRIVEQAQTIKRKAAAAAEARDREAASLIQEVDHGPSPLDIQAQKEAFIRERLAPMLGERRTFLINLDERIRAHGISAFVAGLAPADKALCAELIGITEEQHALMASRPDLFTEDDLRSNLVLSGLLKILAE